MSYENRKHYEQLEIKRIENEKQMREIILQKQLEKDKLENEQREKQLLNQKLEEERQQMLNNLENVSSFCWCNNCNIWYNSDKCSC